MFEEVHKYLEQMIPDRPPVLREMEEYAAQNDFPIVGPLVGRLLYQMAMVTKARKILELGSGFGYSAFWFSLAARSRGRIVMTDSDRMNKRRAFDYFKTAGLESHFDYRIGDALKTVKKLDGPFDIVLNDVDKEQYPQTIELVAGKLRRGGLFITDNLIWDGRVCRKDRDEATEAIVEFTRKLYRDARFFTTILPIRDGVALAYRI